MGLEGMIEDVLASLNPSKGGTFETSNWNGKLPLNEVKDIRKIARAITLAENDKDYSVLLKEVKNGSASNAPPSGDRGAILGITGTGGAGKSSVTDEIVRR